MRAESVAEHDRIGDAIPLPAGTRFGPYEIRSRLGAGGMGEVYRARDSRLKRDVAIKVLLDNVAADADRLVRRDREGKQLGQLGEPGNYINIQLTPDGKTALADRPAADGANTTLSQPRSNSGNYHSWIGDVKRGVFSRLLGGESLEVGATAAPDGRVAISFTAKGTPKDIYLTTRSGSSELQPLVISENVKHPNHFSPDGRFLIYDEHNGDQRQDL